MGVHMPLMPSLFSQAGYQGDLEGHCYQECVEQVQQDYGQQFSVHEEDFGGGFQQFQQFHTMGGGGVGGGGFGGDPRASILEHMMRGGGSPMGGMGMGGFPHGGAGGFGGMGHGYGADAYGEYEGPRTQRVLVEDEYGNRWYEEMDVEEDEMFDHEAMYGGEGRVGT